MSKRHTIASEDAIRLLSGAIYKVHYFATKDMGETPACRDPGELILQDALEYLAWGDTHNARKMIALYEEWQLTGDAPWPWDSTKKPPQTPP